MSDALLSSLNDQHAKIEAEIADAIKHPSFDDLKLSQMKKEKLALKERIEALIAA